MIDDLSVEKYPSTLEEEGLDLGEPKCWTITADHKGNS